MISFFRFIPIKKFFFLILIFFPSIFNFNC